MCGRARVCVRLQVPVRACARDAALEVAHVSVCVCMCSRGRACVCGLSYVRAYVLACVSVYMHIIYDLPHWPV